MCLLPRWFVVCSGRLNPEYDQAMNNLANILKDRGETLEAEALLMKAVDIKWVALLSSSKFRMCREMFQSDCQGFWQFGLMSGVKCEEIMCWSVVAMLALSYRSWGHILLRWML